MGSENDSPVVIAGAGPAGLTAGLALARRRIPVVVCEATDALGGLARTVERDGYRFDLGGHRFFTKDARVQGLWDELLGDELLTRPRQSRIHWRGRMFEYPLSASDVARKLGPLELTRVAGSYSLAALRPRGGERSFEDWVVRRFGRRLFELFFRTYTEKVWGVPCSELRAEWAAQRIRNLSLRQAARDALRRRPHGEVVSLIREFRYPRLGPGQLWARMARELADLGGEIRLLSPLRHVDVRDGRVEAVVLGEEELRPAALISSVPLARLPDLAGAPPEVRGAASGLRFRDLLCVALILEGPAPFPDTWVYVHDPRVQVGRIQNFGAWSPDLVPHADRSCLGMEYFCFRDDALWSLPDDRLVARAAGELQRLGLAAADRLAGGHVVRVADAYPVYDERYAERVAAIRGWLGDVAGLQQIGRNGLHRYNNMDHSMLTGLHAVENLLDDAGHDIWSINAGGAYLEEDRRGPYRRAPQVAGVRA